MAMVGTEAAGVIDEFWRVDRVPPRAGPLLGLCNGIAFELVSGLTRTFFCITLFPEKRASVLAQRSFHYGVELTV